MDIEKLKAFFDMQVRLGKINQKEADDKMTKYREKEEAKATYKAKKSSLTKTEMQALLDTLTS